MNAVIIGNINLYNDFDLILTSKTIGSPEPKTASIDIPGGDGSLDLTENFGDVKYKNRKITLEFATIVSQEQFLSLFSRIQDTFHGKKMKITLTDDPEFYYVGRIYVDEWKSNKRIGIIKIEIDAEPYKYKNAITIVTNQITGATSISCQNLRKQVVPTITASSEVTLVWGITEENSEGTYQKVFSGTITDDNIIFKQGENIVKFTPTGESALITIEYQERGL